MNRIWIHPKDVMVITGRSDRYARKIIAQLKRIYNKMPHQFITISELCEHLGIAKEEINLRN